MPIRPVPQVAIDFLKQVEGCKLTSYQDTGGKWTNGYGHTGGVPANATISQSIADANLVGDADQAANRLSDVVNEPVILGLSDHQYAALISFVFNLGNGEDHNPRWRIWDDLNTGSLADVTTQMMRFDQGKVDGVEQTIPGLLNRREAEVALWNEHDAQTAGALAAPAVAPPSSYTREIATPPRPATIPMHGQSLVAKVGGAVAALGAGASQIHDMVAPHATEAPVFAKVAVGLTAVILAASVLGLYIHSQQTQAAKA